MSEHFLNNSSAATGSSSLNSNNNTGNSANVYASVTIQLDSKKMPSELVLKRDIRKYYEFKEILGT
jgi:hypothetical protein